MKELQNSPLPALPIPLRGDVFNLSQLIQFADKVRTIALLDASNACMNRISQRMIETAMNGHTSFDLESLACAKAIHGLIEPLQLRRLSTDQSDLFAAAGQLQEDLKTA